MSYVARGCNALNYTHRRTVVKNYPFLQFWSVVAVPTAYWIATVELGILWEHDEGFSLTFGQVSIVGVPVSLTADFLCASFIRYSHYLQLYLQLSM